MIEETYNNSDERGSSRKRRRVVSEQRVDAPVTYDPQTYQQIEAVEESIKPKKKFKKFHEHGLHDDIKYRGPISFQGFQVLGWFCIIMSVVTALMKLGIKINPEMGVRFEKSGAILGYLPAMSLPFMLIANFSRLLNNVEGYKKQLLRNGLATLGIFLIFNAFFYKYIVGALKIISAEPEQVTPLLKKLVYLVTTYGFVSFNIFIDLFLCTLFMFFLNYRPKRVFTGKGIIVFRLFSILPVGYELGSLLLKIACANGKVDIPIWAFPLLTVKPPMTFVVFMLMVIFLKFRELRFCRHGNTHEDYEAFLQTNRNSLHFSIFLTVMLIVASIADLIIMIVMMIQQVGSVEAFELMNPENFHPIAIAVGFGKSIPLILISPIMLLYSYTRKPRFEKIGTLIPIVSIGIIVLIMIQGAFQLIAVAKIPKINFKELEEMLRSIVMMLMMG